MNWWHPKSFHDLIGGIVTWNHQSALSRYREGYHQDKSITVRVVLVSLEDFLMSLEVGEPLGSWGFISPLVVWIIPLCIWSVISIFDYLSTESPRLYVWACERENLCLCRAVSGMARLSSRVGGVDHPNEGTALFSFGSWWFGNRKGPSGFLWCLSEAWQCSHLVPSGAHWVFLGETSFHCWALAGIHWQD